MLACARYCLLAATLVACSGGLPLIAAPPAEQAPERLVHAAATLRPGNKVAKLVTDAETVRCTTGHPFWIANVGWKVAKFIHPGERLHALGGSHAVNSLQPEPSTEVYNLVVADWHTYFVGQTMFLVHDNSPLEETSTSLPGLPASLGEVTATE